MRAPSGPARLFFGRVSLSGVCARIEQPKQCAISSDSHLGLVSDVSFDGRWNRNLETREPRAQFPIRNQSNFIKIAAVLRGITAL
jgi:hypothetical protein